MKKDAFYTPSSIADHMVSLALKTPDVVADFASGDGALLSAARRRFPSAALVATDICLPTLKAVRRYFPDVLSGKCDFLVPQSREKNGALREAKGLISLVLMNPPFSCRGGHKSLTSINGKSIKCSQAMAFVSIGLAYLAEGGEIIALLPAGCMEAEKDEQIWSEVRSIAKVEEISSHGHKTFEDCSPRTCIVRITKKISVNKLDTKRLLTSTTTPTAPRSVTLFRGRMQMHAVQATDVVGCIPLVHSTELRDGKLLRSRFNVQRRLADVIHGPAVLIPRVGLPNSKKLVRLTKSKSIMLSDCVLAICCDTEKEADALLSEMIDRWELLENAFGGTGAPYITVRKLAAVLFEMGYAVICHPKGSSQLRKCIAAATSSNWKMPAQRVRSGSTNHLTNPETAQFSEDLA